MFASPGVSPLIRPSGTFSPGEGGARPACVTTSLDLAACLRPDLALINRAGISGYARIETGFHRGHRRRHRDPDIPDPVRFAT